MITFLTISRFSSAINQNLNGMATFFQHYFAGTDNLRIVSIILLLLAFILFLFLIVILYIKSLLSFIKESEATLSSQGGFARRSVEDQELEKELEKELERDLENTKNERAFLREQQKKEKDAFYNAQKEIERQKEEEKKKQKEEEERFKAKTIPFPKPVSVPNFRGNASLYEFDWRTGKQGELDEIAAGLVPFERVQPKPIIDMLGLIINMLGRNIDVGKIAQTIKSRCGSGASEEEIIQTIDSIQNFISLANNGRFLNLPDKDNLPTPEMALIALSKGETAPTLSLMESLINYLVDKAAETNMPQKRDIIFLEASNYACIFGSIANTEDDPALATSAFELALELSPKNANAWSRAADCYAKSKTDSKAVVAYQNVLAYGNENLYPHQIANANQKLAEYYETQGDKQKAATLYGLSNAYYRTIGINTSLTNKELDIISIIESKQEENMPDTVGRLLNLSKKKQYI